MSVIIPEAELAQELDLEKAVEAAYSTELAEVSSKLQRQLPCLIECDKELTPFLYLNVRNRLRAIQPPMRCLYLDGRPAPDQQPGAMPQGMMGTMIAHLREAVRGSVERRVVVLPHLDLLTTSAGGLTAEAREVIPLLYENPELVWLGFKDPSFPLPRVIETLFPHQTTLLGIPRARLRQLINQRESRKFGREFNPWQLYKHVSGVNAVRLRKLLMTLEGEDYPNDPRRAYRQLRQATLTGALEVPNVDLDKDIGGYQRVKNQLRAEILDVMTRKDKLLDAEEIKRMEDLIPKGMIFWGPPGTGKTLFAKGMAAALGAAITIVSGPELKSKWVGESEGNLREVFHRARQSAPAIIVFDELDSFASARGTYTGSGVEHSMVNQLLTEMDGFRKEELVFVIGTTNFVEILDPALLRPGRFEFHLEVPYPDDEDRREIIKIYDKKMNLKLSPDALEYAIRRTSERFTTATGTPFSGDHLNAMCRSIARIRIRENRLEESTSKDVERSFTEFEERVEHTAEQEVRIATHEAGHFICSLRCKNHVKPERITIRSEMPWAAGYVGYDPKAFPKSLSFVTRMQWLDMMCVVCGGIEAEELILEDVAGGASGLGSSSSDLSKLTWIGSSIVEIMGMGGQTSGLRIFRNSKGEREIVSGAQAEALDRQINTLIADARARAAQYLRECRNELLELRDEVLDKKTLEGDALQKFIEGFHKKHPPESAIEFQARVAAAKEAAALKVTAAKEDTTLETSRRRSPAKG
jgi:cell division protease FtsH